MQKSILLTVFVLLGSLSLTGQKNNLRELNKTYIDLDEALKLKEKVFHLNLSNQKLTTIPQEIVELVNLKSLYLSNNNLTSLQFDFSQMANLELIDLNGNQFKDIPVKSLKECKSLKALNFRDNLLTKLKDDVNALSHLLAIDIGNNQIESISESINIVTLQYFRADHNLLSSFPIGLKNMPKLRELNLSDNGITELSKQVLSACKNLKKLNLSYNPIQDFTALKFCSKLKNLKLNGCDLKEHDLHVVFGLGKLRSLYLENTGLKTIPTTLSRMVKLEEFYLNNNRLENLPDALESLKRLKYLDLTGNPVSTLNLIKIQNGAPKAEVNI